MIIAVAKKPQKKIFLTLSLLNLKLPILLTKKYTNINLQNIKETSEELGVKAAKLNYLLFPRWGDWALLKVAVENDQPVEAVLKAGYFDEQWRLNTRGK